MDISFIINIFFILSTTFGLPTNEELFSVDLQYSRAYSSPLIEKSDPSYAIDNDFQLNQPTCVVSQDSIRDPDGYNWLLIDIGIQYHNITEVRITPNPSKIEFSKEVGNISVFIGSYLDVHPQTGIDRLPWADRYDPYAAFDQNNEAKLEYCGQSSGDMKSFMSNAIIKCFKPMQGRWIALRRTVGRLNFCLVNIYVKDAHSEFFHQWPITNQDPSKLPHNVPGNRGFIFRLGKYLTHGQCRVECMKNQECQAILFEQMRYGGACQMVKKFQFGTDLKRPRLECRSLECKVEEALTHRGYLIPLNRSSNLDNRSAMELITSFDGKPMDTEQEWALNWNETQDRFVGNKIFLLSVQLKGIIYCYGPGCGVLDLFSVNSAGEETFCNTINPRESAILDKLVLFCQGDSINYDPVALRMRWRSGSKFNEANYMWEITGGNVRISTKAPNRQVESSTSSALTTTPSTTPSKDWLQKVPTSIPSTTSTPYTPPSTTKSSEVSYSTAPSTTSTSFSPPKINSDLPQAKTASSGGKFFKRDDIQGPSTQPINLWDTRPQDSLQDDPRFGNFPKIPEDTNQKELPDSWTSDKNPNSPEASKFMGFSQKSIFWMVVIACLCGCFLIMACVGIIAWKCSRKSAYTFEPK